MNAEWLLVWKHGTLCFRDLGGCHSRHRSVLRLIAQADREHGLPDFSPVLISSADRPVNRDPAVRVLSFSTADGFEDWAVPDFLFDSWPEVGIDEYEQVRVELAAAGERAAERQAAGWIGNCATHPIRAVLHGLGRQTPVLDVRHVDWRPGPDGVRHVADGEMSLAEQVARWALLIDVEGAGWSARLKLLLHSSRPVLVQERPWREFFFDRLRAWEHYIPVAADLSNLTARAAWALEHPAEADRIGRAGQTFAREHLTRAHAVAEWARVLTRCAADPMPVPEEVRRWAPATSP